MPIVDVDNFPHRKETLREKLYEGMTKKQEEAPVNHAEENVNGSAALSVLKELFPSTEARALEVSSIGDLVQITLAETLLDVCDWIEFTNAAGKSLNGGYLVAAREKMLSDVAFRKNQLVTIVSILKAK